MLCRQPQLRHGAALGTMALLVLLAPWWLARGAPTQQQSAAAHVSTLLGANLEGTSYAQLFGHKHSLSRGHLQRGLAFRGANLRLRRVLRKLLDKEPQQLTAVAVGGSITWGHAVERGRTDWLSLVGSWFSETFPAHNVTVKNAAVPATQSSYVSSCLQQFVPDATELVFVEFAVNDGYHDGSIDNSLVRGFERLLRKLLGLPSSPAVVLVQFLASDAQQRSLPFYATGEDQYGVLAQHYGAPWLSLRDALWHEYMGSAPGFARHQLFPPDEERHPTALGHRYMADLVINLLQQTYIDSLLAPMDEPTLRHHPLAQVPPPMLPGNYESTNLVCVIGRQLPAAVASNRGFTWLNEGSEAKPKWGLIAWDAGATLVLRVDTRAAKVAPNGSAGSGGAPAPARAALPGELPAAPGAAGAQAAARGGGGADMLVWVGHVKSWRGMGTATLRCASGCRCDSVTVDAMQKRRATQQVMAKLLTTQAEECLIAIEVSEASSSGQHKFKVTGIMVTRLSPDASTHGDFTDATLLEALQPLGEEGVEAASGQRASGSGGGGP